MQGIITRNILNDNVFDLDDSDDYHYFVYLEFPFPLIHENELNYREYSPRTHIAFVRRLAAERYILLQLISHYDKLGDTDQVNFYKAKSKNIEKEHPEWLI